MLYNLINKLDEMIHFSTVSAHSDIPCKIYDTYSAVSPYPAEQLIVNPVLTK